jgi:hypothetical protein
VNSAGSWKEEIGVPHTQRNVPDASLTFSREEITCLVTYDERRVRACIEITVSFLLH